MKNHFLLLSYCFVIIFCSCNSVFETGKKQHETFTKIEHDDYSKKTMPKNNPNISNYQSENLNLTESRAEAVGNLKDKIQIKTNKKQHITAFENIESNEISLSEAESYKFNSDVNHADYQSISTDFKGKTKKSKKLLDDDYKGSILLKILASVGIIILCFLLLYYSVIGIFVMMIWIETSVLGIFLGLVGVALSIFLAVKLMKLLWKKKISPDRESGNL